MNRGPVRVIKLGGSLLDYAELPRDLRHWLAHESPAHYVIVVGGGELANEIRRAHNLYGLDQTAAHWLCVDLLSVTTRLVAELLPEASVILDYPQLCESLLIKGGLTPLRRPTPLKNVNQGLTLFDAWSYLHENEPRLPGKRLPKNWDVSSDSIAARLAITIGADELVLLKSALPCSPPEIDQLVASGYVDRFFKEFADQLPPTRAVNLRADGYPSVRLK